MKVNAKEGHKCYKRKNRRCKPTEDNLYSPKGQAASITSAIGRYKATPEWEKEVNIQITLEQLPVATNAVQCKHHSDNCSQGHNRTREQQLVRHA